MNRYGGLQMSNQTNNQVEDLNIYTRERNFKLLQSELNENNTIFPFYRKGSDESEVDFDNIDYVVMRLSPEICSNLKSAFEVARIKTSIQKAIGNYSDDSIHTSDILQEILEREMNAGRLDKFSEELLQSYWYEYALQNEDSQILGCMESLNEELIRNDCERMLENSSFKNFYLNAEQRMKLAESEF